MSHDGNTERRLTNLTAELAASIERWRRERDAAEPRAAQPWRRDATSRRPAPPARDARPESRAGQRPQPRVEAPAPAPPPAEPRPEVSPLELERLLERLIDRDWSQLRERHETALRELRDHAHTLSRVTIAAANSSVSGVELAEARLMELSRALSVQMASLGDQMTGLGHEISSAVSQLRPSPSSTTPVLPAAAAPAAESTAAPVVEPAAEPAHAAEPMLGRAATPASEPGTTDTFDGAVESPSAFLSSFESDEPASPSMGRRILTVLALAAILGGGGAAAWKFRTDSQAALARAADSQREAEAALLRAQQELAASRDEATQQSQQLVERTARADRLAAVVTAGDLVRFAVSAPRAAGATGQVLWSRSRGVALVASRVPAAPADMTYQLWLRTTDGPVSAGTFVPGEGDRTTVVLDAPAATQPVIGAFVTVESPGGSTKPSDRILVQSARFSD